MEKPAGEKSMGSWTAYVYTAEQQQRLGVDEWGRYSAEQQQQLGVDEWGQHTGVPQQEQPAKATKQAPSKKQSANAGQISFKVELVNGVLTPGPLVHEAPHGGAFLQGAGVRLRRAGREDGLDWLSRIDGGRSLEYLEWYDTDRDGELSSFETLVLTQQLRNRMAIPLSLQRALHTSLVQDDKDQDGKLGSSEFDQWIGELLAGKDPKIFDPRAP